MADDTPSQKDISAAYQRNLRYFRQPHALRRLRLWAFAIVGVLTMVVVASYSYWGKDEAFSPGPISESHGHFASDCRSCHAGLETGIFAGIPKALNKADPARTDQSCLNCHPTLGLHLPQANRLTLRPVADALVVVHATGCASCHREHVGRSRIAMPGGHSCIDCHDDAEKLRRATTRIELPGKAVAKEGENRDLGDGLVRFLSASRPVGTLTPFSTYADGHPPFAYEHPDRRDPARLFYNHERHLRGDIAKLPGNRTLDCTFCHQPGPGGVDHQRVNYESHCQVCHKLIHSDFPELPVPHGDPQKTRYFFDSLLATLKPDHRETLELHGLGTRLALEKSVFGPNKGGKFNTECAKCHEVRRGTGDELPVVADPNIADRWVQNGPFTHLPHQHIECVDCHAKAVRSEHTADILLPPKALCAECHRPAGTILPFSSGVESHLHESINKSALAAKQVKNGGIKAECQSCHNYHTAHFIE